MPNLAYAGGSCDFNVTVHVIGVNLENDLLKTILSATNYQEVLKKKKLLEFSPTLMKYL